MKTYDNNNIVFFYFAYLHLFFNHFDENFTNGFIYSPSDNNKEKSELGCIPYYST